MTPPDPVSALESARESVPERLRTAVRSAGANGFLVGGAIRDALLGIDPGPDLDVAIEGDVDGILDLLGVEWRGHERFGTATVLLDGRSVDLARTRRETYSAPGALPDVEPASLADDLGRRDFSVNAMALPLEGPAELIDPFGGRADLEARSLRVLHHASIADDPTRSLRAARYAARLGLEPEPGTLEQIRATDLATVSVDRVQAELLRIGAEPEAVGAFALLDEWGVIKIGDDCLALLRDAAEYVMTDPWSRLVERPLLLATIATADPAVMRAADELASAPATAPQSLLYERARGHGDLVLAVARAKGAEWLDLHVTEWRRVELSIDGEALMAAGVPQGPQVGIGLTAALHARLDGAIPATREEELRVALAAVETAGEPA